MASSGFVESPVAEASDLRDRFEAEALPHIHDLYRAASRILGSRSEAEDVVQEVFLTAWKSFDRFERRTNCRAWLFKILFYSIRHHWRRLLRFPRLSGPRETSLHDAAVTPSLPDHLADEEILAALDRLPQDFREVVLLADVEEFSYKEIAGILNVPAGTVMSRLSRARRLLRAALAGVAQSYGIGADSARREGE